MFLRFSLRFFERLKSLTAFEEIIEVSLSWWVFWNFTFKSSWLMFLSAWELQVWLRFGLYWVTIQEAVWTSDVCYRFKELRWFCFSRSSDLLYDWSWKLVDLVYLTLDPVLWVWCPFSDPSLRTAWVKVSDLGYEIGAEVAELEKSRASCRMGYSSANFGATSLGLATGTSNLFI